MHDDWRLLLQLDSLAEPFRLQLPCPAEVEAAQLASLCQRCAAQCDGRRDEATTDLSPDRCVNFAALRLHRNFTGSDLVTITFETPCIYVRGQILGRMHASLELLLSVESSTGFPQRLSQVVYTY